MDETFKMPNWHLEYGRGENVKYLLFAFTELGVAMLSSAEIPNGNRNQPPDHAGFHADAQ